MRRVPVRLLPLLLVAGALSGVSCGGKRYYPVRGQVFVNNKPAPGVMLVFHPVQPEEGPPVLPSAVVEADGSFTLRTFVVQERAQKEGAPAGEYLVSCTWYPPDLQKYLGNAENLPDKLHGKYANSKTSGLRATVREEPTELAPFKLEVPK